MARKPNYSFEKNARAKAKADKKEAKRLAKLAAKNEAGGDEPDLDDEGGTEDAEAAAEDGRTG